MLGPLAATLFVAMASGRIQDTKNPYQTTPMDADLIQQVGELERTIEDMQSDQEKLQSGALKQAEYDKSLAEKTAKVAEIAAKEPRSAPVQTSAARAYIQAGDYAIAVTHATQAMALAPKDPFPVTTRGLAYFRSGDFPRAAEDAKRALALDPNDSVAKAIFELSKDRVPGDGGAGLKNALARAGRELSRLPGSPYAADAARVESGALRGPPGSGGYASERGRALARRLDLAERAISRRDFLTAYAHANEAIAMHADNPRAQAARAVSAWNLGEYRTTVADASAVLKALPARDSTQHPMLIARAAASSELGRYADALRDAQAAIDHFPASGRAYLERAIAREGLREPPEGVLEDFKRAAELDARFTPEYERALARLGGRARNGATKGRPGPAFGLMRVVDRVLESDSGFAAYCAALVLVVAVAARLLRRRTP